MSEKKDLTGIFDLPLTPEMTPEQTLDEAPAPTPEPAQESSLSFEDLSLGTPAPGFSPNTLPDFLNNETLNSETPPTSEPLTAVKEFSERMSTGIAAVPAAFPFSLSIEGALKPDEKDKLLEILSRENMGIREVDLEPQFAAGRILIPRISEFAGVILVQALRGIQAKMRLAPSDEVFSTEDTRENASDPWLSGTTPAHAPVQQNHYAAESPHHPAEDLPVTTGASIPGIHEPSVIDAMIATTLIPARLAETNRSSELHEVIDALKRELKYKAYRKGAVGLIGFQIQLTPLAYQAHYRLQASATAIKHSSQDKKAARSVGPEV